MSAINDEMLYNPNDYLTSVHAGVYVERRAERVTTIDVESRWEKISEIFSNYGKFDNLPWNDDIKISSLAVYMLYRINDKKFEQLSNMLASRNINGLAKYVDKHEIPLMCELRGLASSGEDASSGANSLGEQTSSPDKSEDKIASSSDGSAKSKRKKKKISESSGSESSSYIFTQKQEESVEEPPYMHEQKGASWFTVSTPRFRLSDEAKSNLRGERGGNHFVDLKHINEAMGKILTKNISDGDEYAPTYQIGANKFLRMVVRKHFNTPLMLITCYYMNRSELMGKEPYRSMSNLRSNQAVDDLPKLTGKVKSEYVRIS